MINISVPLFVLATSGFIWATIGMFTQDYHLITTGGILFLGSGVWQIALNRGRP